MRWVTRSGARLDRASMIWLIRREIDPGAEIAFLPEGEVMAYAAEHGATAFHHPGAELRNTGLRTGFDALVAREQLTDPALTVLALIVRGVETPARDLTPWSAGLRAIALGLRAHHAGDEEFVAAIGQALDGLYRFCQDLVSIDAAPVGR
jgi:hypothetical protein